MAYPSTPWRERFWAKVNKNGPVPQSGTLAYERGITSPCWLWTAGLFDQGYGQFWRSKGRTRKAHIVAYELMIGPVPEGLDLDHLCRVRHCVNSGHLEPVPIKVNLLRGEGVCAKNARKTHCKRGHEFTPENTKTVPGGRACRECGRQADRQRIAANPEEHRRQSRESMQRTRDRRTGH